MNIKTNLEILEDLRNYFDTYCGTDEKYFPSIPITFRTDRMRERRDALEWALSRLDPKEGDDNNWWPS